MSQTEDPPQDPPDTAPTHRVPSEHAEPSRPGGYDGVRQPIAAAPVPPPEPAPADAALAESVRAALRSEGRLADARIVVAVRDGLATLTGEVPLEYQHGLATACASAIPGVLVVQNRLAVAQRGPMRRPDDTP